MFTARGIEALIEDDRFRYFSIWYGGARFVQATYDANVRPASVLRAFDNTEILANSPDALAFSILAVYKQNGEHVFSTHRLRRFHNIIDVLNDEKKCEELISGLRDLRTKSRGIGIVPGYTEAYDRVLKVLSK